MWAAEGLRTRPHTVAGVCLHARHFPVICALAHCPFRAAQGLGKTIQTAVFLQVRLHCLDALFAVAPMVR